MTHCCVFFYSDSSVVHVPKSKLTLRGNFDIGEEVEAKFKVAVADKENGKVSESWVNYLGKIVLLDASKYNIIH